MQAERTIRRGDLEIATGDCVATVTIDRAAKHNALTAAFWHDLSQTLAELAAMDDIPAIVLTGAGDKAFSAGGDVGGFLELKDEASIRAFQTDAMRACRDIERCPVPVIAAVNGIAMGGGCELALACDMVIAADHATFAMPEARFGLVPGFGILRGPDIIGIQTTKYLVMTGATIDAHRAQAIGLVQEIVPAAALIDRATSLAQSVAALSPNAASVGKRMVNVAFDEDDVPWSVDELSRLQASTDRAEGIAAFLERRPASFAARSKASA